MSSHHKLVSYPIHLSNIRKMGRRNAKLKQFLIPIALEKPCMSHVNLANTRNSNSPLPPRSEDAVTE